MTPKATDEMKVTCAVCGRRFLPRSKTDRRPVQHVVVFAGPRLPGLARYYDYSAGAWLCAGRREMSL